MSLFLVPMVSPLYHTYLCTSVLTINIRCDNFGGDQFTRKLAWCTCCLPYLWTAPDHCSGRILLGCWYSFSSRNCKYWWQNPGSSQIWTAGTDQSCWAAPDPFSQPPTPVLSPDWWMGYVNHSGFIWPSLCSSQDCMQGASCILYRDVPSVN